MDDGILAVTPSTLRGCADRCQSIGESVSALSRPAMSACADAARAHRAWRFGIELSALAPLWQRQLARYGSALSADATKLKNSADTYASAEGGITNLMRPVDARRSEEL